MLHAMGEYAFAVSISGGPEVPETILSVPPACEAPLGRRPTKMAPSTAASTVGRLSTTSIAVTGPPRAGKWSDGARKAARNPDVAAREGDRVGARADLDRSSRAAGSAGRSARPCRRGCSPPRPSRADCDSGRPVADRDPIEHLGALRTDLGNRSRAARHAEAARWNLRLGSSQARQAARGRWRFVGERTAAGREWFSYHCSSIAGSEEAERERLGSGREREKNACPALGEERSRRPPGRRSQAPTVLRRHRRAEPCRDVLRLDRPREPLSELPRAPSLAERESCSRRRRPCEKRWHTVESSSAHGGTGRKRVMIAPAFVLRATRASHDTERAARHRVSVRSRRWRRRSAWRR